MAGLGSALNDIGQASIALAAVVGNGSLQQAATNIIAPTLQQMQQQMQQMHQQMQQNHQQMQQQMQQMQQQMQQNHQQIQQQLSDLKADLNVQKNVGIRIYNSKYESRPDRNLRPLYKGNAGGNAAVGDTPPAGVFPETWMACVSLTGPQLDALEGFYSVQFMGNTVPKRIAAFWKYITEEY